MKLSNLVKINVPLSVFECIPKMTPVLSNKEKEPTQPYCSLEDLSSKNENIFLFVLLHSRVLEGKFLWIKNREAHGSQFSDEKQFLQIKKLKQSYDYTTT